MTSMARTFVPAAALAALMGTVSTALGQTTPLDSPRLSTVSVNVGTFRNREGALGCRLYRSSEGFPLGATGAVERRVPIGGDVTPCTFTGVAPGTYAVTVMHDENGNGKLDTNFLGIPTEGYGVSKNHTYSMSKPTWSESMFTVEAGHDVQLGVGLRY